MVREMTDQMTRSRRSRYDCLESQVSRSSVAVCADVSSGMAFQIRGPATVKALLPTVESLTDGWYHSRRLVPAERSDHRPGRSATRARGPKCRGEDPCMTLYGSTAILYSIRSGARSQWRLANASVIWSAAADLMW